MRIKNWHQFQHYKHRGPPWIKLHFQILTSPDWVMLDDASKLLAVVCMLIASKYNGEIPASCTPAYFKRVAYLDKLPNFKPLIECGFLIETLANDSNVKQMHTNADTEESRGETETETETEKNKNIRSLRSLDSFSQETLDDWPEDYRERFWKQYPRRIGRKTALKKLEIIRKSKEVTFLLLMSAVSKIPVDNPKFIPHPATWLNRGGWDDENLSKEVQNGTPTAGDRARAFAAQIREIEIAKGIGRPSDVFGSGGLGGEPSGSISERKELL